jgi:NAD kinase
MAEAWRRVGAIVNPGAGSGIAVQSVRDALSALGAKEVLTGPGPTGAGALSDWQGHVVAHEVTARSGREQTGALARWIVAQNVDAIVVVGGDGTLADVAQVLVELSCRAPVLGIGAGSTNVGRLITCRVGEVSELRPEKLETWNVACLAARVDGDLMGQAFNDVVVGQTIVGTLDGQVRDIDAAERHRGVLVAGSPRPVGTSKTKVIRRNKDGETVVAQGEGVGTVVAGFAEPAFFGKAVSGGICLATLTGLPAGCLVSSLPLVQVEITASALLRAAPIVSSYVTLSEGVNIVVENVCDGAVLCVDGNPLRVLSSSERVIISSHENAVTGVRFRKNLRST